MSDDRPILVAFNGSAESGEAVRVAASLFGQRPLLVVSVWEPGLAIAYEPMDFNVAAYAPSVTQIEAIDRVEEDHAASVADAGVQIAAAAGGRAEAISVADVADVARTLVEIADDRDAAVLVIGSRGRTGVKSHLSGSTTKSLLRDTRRPVLVVRLPEE